MRILRGLMIVAGVAALGACDFNKFEEVDAINEVQAVGSPFTQKLTGEYKDFVNQEVSGMKDHADAIHFARKGLSSARGDVVMPEPLGDWNIQPENMDELSVGRGRLVAMYDLGAREAYPDVSAVAQARFDCWIEQQEENFQPDDIARCKREFLAALEQLEGAMPQAAPPAPAAAENPLAVDPNAPMAAENAMYLVFFDWDKSDLGPGAQSVLDAVAAEASKRSLNAITVVGHADRSGPDGYNDKLAQRRANAVREALAQRGIATSIIRTESRGENENLVATPDNVREPANRRAQISFE